MEMLSKRSREREAAPANMEDMMQSGWDLRTLIAPNLDAADFFVLCVTIPWALGDKMRLRGGYKSFVQQAARQVPFSLDIARVVVQAEQVRRARALARAQEFFTAGKSYYVDELLQRDALLELRGCTSVPRDENTWAAPPLPLYVGVYEARPQNDMKIDLRYTLEEIRHPECAARALMGENGKRGFCRDCFLGNRSGCCDPYCANLKWRVPGTQPPIYMHYDLATEAALTMDINGYEETLRLLKWTPKHQDALAASFVDGHRGRALVHHILRSCKDLLFDLHPAVVARFISLGDAETIQIAEWTRYMLMIGYPVALGHFNSNKVIKARSMILWAEGGHPPVEPTTLSRYHADLPVELRMTQSDTLSACLKGAPRCYCVFEALNTIGGYEKIVAEIPRVCAELNLLIDTSVPYGVSLDCHNAMKALREKAVTYRARNGAAYPHESYKVDLKHIPQTKKATAEESARMVLIKAILQDQFDSLL